MYSEKYTKKCTLSQNAVRWETQPSACFAGERINSINILMLTQGLCMNINVPEIERMVTKRLPLDFMQNCQRSKIANAFAWTLVCPDLDITMHIVSRYLKGKLHRTQHEKYLLLYTEHQIKQLKTDIVMVIRLLCQLLCSYCDLNEAPTIHPILPLPFCICPSVQSMEGTAHSPHSGYS